MRSVLIPAEEERSREGAGEEGEVEGEKGGQAAEEGRPGGGGGRGERPAGGGPPGEWLPSPRRARAGEDEREAAQENLLQEEQDGQCVCFCCVESFHLCHSDRATEPFLQLSLEKQLQRDFFCACVTAEVQSF